MVKADFIEHELVPKHSKLSDKQTEALLKQYNISKAQLPKVKITDQALKPLGPKVGDVISVERNSLTMGKSKYYRVVIDA